MKYFNNFKNIIAIIIAMICCCGLCACRKSDRNTRENSNIKESSIEKITEENTDKNNVKNNERDTNYSAGRDVFAMDTYMTVQAYGENADEAVDKAINEIERLDTMLSATAEESEINIINSNGGGKVTDDVATLLERAKEIYDETEGRFNIAIYPVVEEWGFASGEYKVPDKREISKLLELTDFSKVHFDKASLSVTYEMQGMKIDFGGIAKGYTSAKIMDIFMELGIESGIVNLGGNVQVLGTKTDGSDWRVAIQDPLNEEEYIGVLSTRNKAVITSGGYERYFEEDGIRYHHIINPDTGYPANSGLISVTIVCADGTMADCLSTSLFIMGKDGAIRYWKNHKNEFDIILYTEKEELYVSEGIADSFSSSMKINVVNAEE